jgi:heme exporter protein D
MQWGSASEFFAMGGYAFYVWGSYAVAALAMVAEVWSLVSRRRAIAKMLGREAMLNDEMKHEAQT